MINHGREPTRVAFRWRIRNSSGTTTPNGSENGKVCIVFDFGKLRATLNQTLQPGNAALKCNGKLVPSNLFGELRDR